MAAFSGTAFLAAALQGRIVQPLTKAERTALAVAGTMMLFPDLIDQWQEAITGMEMHYEREGAFALAIVAAAWNFVRRRGRTVALSP